MKMNVMEKEQEIIAMEMQLVQTHLAHSIAPAILVFMEMELLAQVLYFHPFLFSSFDFSLTQDMKTKTKQKQTILFKNQKKWN